MNSVLLFFFFFANISLMDEIYIDRQITKKMLRFAKIYPVIGLYGPRQSGKTTLIRKAFPHLPYVSLENIDKRDQALEDPRQFLKFYKQGAVFDEIQRAPDLLSYLQQEIDENPKPGRFVLTGSQHFVLGEMISQSLAGRIGLLELLPMNYFELKTGNWEKKDLLEGIRFGGYPRLFKNRMEPEEFFSSYITSYLEKDVRQIKNIIHLGHFQLLLQLLAAQVGQTLNMSELSVKIGVSVPTVHAWIGILQASYVIFLVQPFYQNLTKRIVKSPKIYFYDTGVAAYLCRIQKNQDFLTQPLLKGALFENFVILEIQKAFLNQGLKPQIWFYRDDSGLEVDLLIEKDACWHAIEIKSHQTVQKKDVKNLYKLKTNWENAIPKPLQLLLISDSEEGHLKDVQLVHATQAGSLFF
jgi:predicted AAA+ superfamily ATPase